MPATYRKSGLISPLQDSSFRSTRTQGGALGYHIAPRWGAGKERVASIKYLELNRQNYSLFEMEQEQE